jgi:hypothetical protein
VKSPFFLDTSILLGGLIEMGEPSRFPQALMSAVVAGKIAPVCTAWHCCLEFLSVSTRLPPELRLTLPMALRLVEEEVLARFEVRELPADARPAFLRAVASDRIGGGRVYDAHIAEVARAARAGWVVTENRRHFTSLLRHGIKVVTAEELVSQMRT